MFAFIIFDSLKKKVFVARDRFGVKPVYYWHSDSGFIAFASEIKQFTALPSWQSRLNPSAINDFLTYGIVDHGCETCFQNIYQLRPGEKLTCSLSKYEREIKPEIWYTPSPKFFEGDFSKAVNDVHALLEDSIRIRLRADVPVGSCLSGGLDSSTIVCLVRQLLGEEEEQQSTFSARSTDLSLDEGKYIDAVVRMTKTCAHEVYPSPEEILGQLPKILWHQDEPFASSSAFAQWAVFHLVKESGIKVVLDGQGADELLAGYSRYGVHHAVGLIENMRWKQLLSEYLLSDQRGLLPRSALFFLFRSLPYSLRTHIKSLVGDYLGDSQWLNRSKLAVESKDTFWMEDQASVDGLGYSHLVRSSLPMLLHLEDRNSMAHSVESRTPFLDVHLVEYLLGLPESFKLKNGWSKRVVRESVKGLIPESIRTRRDKIGFATSESIWMCKVIPNEVRKRLKELCELSEGVISSNIVQSFDSMASGHTKYRSGIWRALVFGEWLKTYEVRMS